MRKNKRIFLSAFLLFIPALFLFSQAPVCEKGAGETTEKKRIEILLQHKIEMCDGITLAANIYKPRHMPKPLPAIFCFTPYIADEGQNWGPFFAENGYVYLQVDVRGRGNSGDKFFPLVKEGADGARVVRWISSQPWCSGKVAMRGGSYRGLMQWQTLKHILNKPDCPPVLKTIAPSAAPAVGYGFPGINNIHTSFMIKWLGDTKGKTSNALLYKDSDYWFERYYEVYSKREAFCKLPKITDVGCKIVNTWFDHPYIDDYWQGFSFPDESYKKIDIRILNITGYFDFCQRGALHYFRKHMEFGEKWAKENHYLVIGPWDHPGTRNPKRKVNGLVFCKNSLLDMNCLHLAWYDWILKGKKKPAFLKKRICYYIMHKNEWVYRDNLDEVSNRTMDWYLASVRGQAHDVFRSGTLEAEPPRNKRQQPDIFVYAPLNRIPKDQCQKGFVNFSYTDQSAAFRDHKLIYHSPPLEKKVEIAGFIKLTAYLEINVRDTDLTMSVFEIKTNGTSLLLARDILRARYRKSLYKPELITPGKIEKYVFDKSNFTAVVVEKGSRLRLIVTALNSPQYEKNFNTGGDAAREAPPNPPKAVIKLYHTRQYPSVLEIPYYLDTGKNAKK